MLQNILNYSKSEFVKNILALMTGTAVAQALPLLASPYLIKIYTPEAFGIFGLLVAICSILSVVVNGRYELAIVLPKLEKDAFAISSLSVAISGSTCCFLLVLIFFFPEYLAVQLVGRELYTYLCLAPIITFLTSHFNVLSYLLIRRSKFSILSKANAGKAIIALSIQVIIGSFYHSVIILIAGWLCFLTHNLFYFSKIRRFCSLSASPSLSFY